MSQNAAAMSVVFGTRELLDVAQTLAQSYDLPTGSVLRCLSRAAHRARLAGCPPDALPQRAETAARRTLDRRTS